MKTRNEQVEPWEDTMGPNTENWPRGGCYTATLNTHHLHGTIRLMKVRGWNEMLSPLVGMIPRLCF